MELPPFSSQPPIGTVLRVSGALFLIFVLGACRDLADPVRPEALPYRFAPAEKMGPFVPADLDGDGTDEILRRISTQSDALPHPETNALLLETQSGKVMEQVNFAHPIHPPHPLDVTGDGTLEILVPFFRNDSLFLSIVTADGTKRNRLYVTEGDSRREPDGTLPWDPEVRDVFWTDTDGNGTRELLTVVQTHYARLPRGVWIHELPSGRLLGKCIVGATLDWWELDNFDDDPHQELLVAAGASNNGAQAGGMSDQYAYHYAFDLGHPPSVQWKREMRSPFTRAGLRSGDLDGDGGRDYVGFVRSTEGRVKPTQFHLLDPGTGTIRQRKILAAPVERESVVFADLDDDERDELLVLDASGVLHQLGRGLKEEARARVGPEARRLDRVTDVTGDGRAEVLLSRADRTLNIVNRGGDLSIRASVSGILTWRIVRRGPETQPYLYGANGDQATLYRLVPNRYWWLYRWGPWALGLFGIGLLLGGGYGAWRGYRRYRQAQELCEQIEQTVDTPLFLVRDEAHVEPLNPPARRWLERHGPPGKETEDGTHDALPSELISWLESLEPHPDRVHETELTEENSEEPIQVQARFVSESSGWLLHVVPAGAQADPEARRTWRLMAQRVAHDLRNPLTSIRLTLQSMQMTYREAAPGAADQLDAYTRQIEGRIESLRRTATNVMKLVGAEETNPLETDLSVFLRRETQALAADVPDDVELRRDLTEDLPPVSVDREQMTSVLENLLHNAVEALPEGGTITIQTQLARDLLFSSDPTSRDYVVAEVMDTGTGMDKATQARAFEPGFTTGDRGTGLGLSLVEKIVTDHGGHVEVESEAEVGTAVCIYLPVADEA